MATLEAVQLVDKNNCRLCFGSYKDVEVARSHTDDVKNYLRSRIYNLTKLEWNNSLLKVRPIKSF